MRCIVSSLVGDDDNAELMEELEASPENQMDAQDDVGADEDDPNVPSLDWVEIDLYFVEFLHLTCI